MAFVAVGGSRNYIKYADCDVGEVIVEGTYLGEETSKFNNLLYIFRQDADGSVVCLNETGKLKKFIEENVQTGDRVQVIYQGKKVISSGKMAGKEAHDFSFFIDEDYKKVNANAKSNPTPSVAKKPISAVFSEFADEAL